MMRNAFRLLSRLSLPGLCLLAMAFVLASCGSSGSSSSPGNVRLVNATAGATLSLIMNGGTVASAIAPRSVGTYASVTAGTYSSSIASANSVLTSQVFSQPVASGVNYTVVAYERGGSVNSVTFTDNQTLPSTGYTTLTLAHESPDAGTLDIYILPAGTTSLTSSTLPNLQSIYTQVTSTTLVAGSYVIIATAAGRQSDVRFQSTVTLTGGQVEVLALTEASGGSSGGALLDGTLIIQSGAATFLPSTSSRVRVVSALPTTPVVPVTASFGGTTLGPVYAPNPGGYSLVASGTGLTAITINNAAATATLPTTVPATGQDYTALIYGTTAAPLVNLLTDTNLSAGTQAKIRVINAGYTGSDLSVTVSGTQAQFLSIGYGQASSYSGITPTNAPAVVVSGGGTQKAVASVPSFLAGGVYTIFVYDAALDAVVSVDR